MKLNFLSKFFPAAAAAAILSHPLSGLGAVAHVSVVNNAFIPASTNIAVNDQVIWTWPSGSNNHDVHSTSTPQAWTSSAVLNGPANFTNTFTSKGTFPYECTVHLFTGSIIVITNNVPPSVSITNPASGTVFIAPANVTIQASASDSDGSVTNVQFRIGSTILTNKAAAPFSATTNNLAAGSYTLTAIASDNLGATATNSVSIVVDTPPVVTITNPVSGTLFIAPANVTVQASASDSDIGDSVTNVQFLIGSTILTNKAAAPFSAVTNNLAAGSYTLSAVASDNNGVKNTNSISLSVVTPVTVSLGGSTKSSGTNFQFSYPANVGLSYDVERSTNLITWIPLVTNTAASNPVVFMDIRATNSQNFYRVGRMPNP